MIQSNKINIIVAVTVVFALIISIALVAIGNMQSKDGSMKTKPEYATKIFGTDIISIEIIADEADWQEMLDNAIREQYIMVDVIVNGKKFKNVGIRPKGNSSLNQVARSNSDRYSFRLQFDEYIKGQTCFGLESFVVNNMLGDNTYMKEYVSYDLMHEVGVDAPYFGYVDIKVNGEGWGLYLAVELYNESYEQRVSGDTSGMLYNVKSMDMGGNDDAEQPGQGGIAPAMPGWGNVPAMPGWGNVPAMPGGENLPAIPGMQNGRPQMPFDGQFQPNPGFQRNRGEQPFIPPDGNNIPNFGNNTPSFGSLPNTDNNNFPAQTPPGQSFPAQDFPEQGFPAQGIPGQRFPVEGFPGQNVPAEGFPEQRSPAQNPAVQNPPPQMGGANRGMDINFGGGGGRGSSGGSLEYIGDNTESYSAIFNNVVGKGTESDFQRVIKALKALSEGRELETYFDVDQILRYLAAHTFVVNLDSYSSGMAQNYYIYEREGKVTILPWDYNLAWGGFQRGSASNVINFPIDTPVSGVEMSSRPLIEKLFANAEYLERYHSYLQQLVDNYFANGKFEAKIIELDTLISDYVKNDATAFCTYEEYKTAVSTFITLGKLRAQSVQGQLNGTVPSTTTEQNKNPTQLISAGNLNLSDLGSMMGGRVGNNMGFSGGILGGQFGNMLQNDEQRNPPDNIGIMRQGRQNSNIVNRVDARVPTDQGLRNNNPGFIAALLFVLVAAIVYAARFKKCY